jgi:hypothetical protein
MQIQNSESSLRGEKKKENLTHRCRPRPRRAAVGTPHRAPLPPFFVGNQQKHCACVCVRELFFFFFLSLLLLLFARAGFDG